MKRIKFITIFFITASYLSAQTNDLTQDQIDDIQKEASDQIERLQRNFEILTDKNRSNEVKQHTHEETLRLFIGRGKSYEDIYGNLQEPVYIQVSNLRTGAITSRPIDEYLRRLRNLPNSKLVITKADFYYISDICKVGDHYQAFATKFPDKHYPTHGRLVTNAPKIIQILVDFAEDFAEKKTFVLLGDIEVTETVEF